MVALTVLVALDICAHMGSAGVAAYRSEDHIELLGIRTKRSID